MLAVVFDLWERTRADDFLILSAGLLSASAVIWRQGIRPMRDAFRQGARAWEWVEDQMKPNGGESLRDQIDNIAKTLALIPELIERVERLEAIVTQNTKEPST